MFYYIDEYEYILENNKYYILSKYIFNNLDVLLIDKKLNLFDRGFFFIFLNKYI